MGKNATSEIKGNFDLMKKSIPKLWQRFIEHIEQAAQRVRAFSSKLWQFFWEHFDIILFIFVSLLASLVLLAGFVIFRDGTASSLQQLLGLRSEKYDVLKFIGYCVAGIVSIWLAWAANKRANAMDATAKNTEAGQRQERLKNAIEHLGHDRDSVRMGGAYELFHLAKDTRDLRQTVMDILCAHIRQTTRGKDYQTEYKTKPSEEIQSLLTLLFVQKHNDFEDCSINLQGSYLNGATLRQARLKKADLIEAQLQGAVLIEAQLQEAKLWDARLQGANLLGAQMQGTDLSDAQLQGAILWNAQLQRADLSRAELQGAHLSEAELQGASLSRAELQGASLSRAELQGADLSGAELQRANLMGAELQGADLSKAQLQRATLWQAQLQGTDLMEAQLQGADLLEAQLQGADLMEAQLQGATLWEAQMQGANLSKAQLQGANLSKVQLQGADLMEAQLQGTKLMEMQLQGVSSHEAYPREFEDKIRDRIGKSSDLTGIIFAGGLQEKNLDTLCERLSDDQAQVLRETLRPHVGEPASNKLHPDRGADTRTSYTQEEAEQWIAEYQEAMRGVPKRDDS